MSSEVGFEVVDTESGTSWLEVTDQDLGNIDHKHSQISRIVNRDLVDIHKIFQPPELFGVAEVELDLETKTVIVDEFIESQFQIAAEKDNPSDFLSFEVGFDDDDNIEFIGYEFVPQCHLIDFGLDAIKQGGLFEIFVGNMIVIEFGSILFIGAALFLFPFVGKVYSLRIKSDVFKSLEFGDEQGF